MSTAIMPYKIGSLFDGSGGFPLAGSLCGIVPAWASEVEPYPIAVTRSRFPTMKHLGDISKINGGEIEPVDIICAGSPCQDLSVAGLRKGLRHEANGDEETTRSGLFMEFVRIIKEMRRATDGKYPSFALWENVPGAFSSNKGDDFRVVLEELIKIVEPTCKVPPMPKGGWPYADAYVGDGWSLAYRVFDAQYWGVPQRRRRIHLVLDLRGERALSVLAQREGLRGYFAEGRTPWQATAGDAQSGSGADGRAGIGLDLYNLAVSGGIAVSLTANTGTSGTHSGPTVSIPYTLKIRSGCEGGGKGALIQTDKSATLSTLNDQYLFQPVPGVLLDDQGGQQISVRTDDKCPTLRAEAHGNVPAVVCENHPPISFQGKAGAEASLCIGNDVAASLLASKELMVAYSIENHPADSRVDIDESGKVQTLTSRMGTGGGNVPMVMEPIPIHDQATRFSGKRGDKSDGKGNGLGVGEPGDPMNTLTSGDRHAVAYGVETFHCNTEEEKVPTLKARDWKDPNVVVYAEEQAIAIDRAFFNQGQNALYDPQFYTDGTVPTLVARGPSAVAVRYIVRRLTPTECARLQGFADRWGDIDGKDVFTQDEFQFWREVRQTHDAINGKKRQEYTEKQIIAWYNKLHTDSAEYKMWGNGIALPPALYVMQGIVDALKGDGNHEEC